jgi:hypothetical protein
MFVITLGLARKGAGDLSDNERFGYICASEGTNRYQRVDLSGK